MDRMKPTSLKSSGESDVEESSKVKCVDDHEKEDNIIIQLFKSLKQSDVPKFPQGGNEFLIPCTIKRTDSMTSFNYSFIS